MRSFIKKSFFLTFIAVLVIGCYGVEQKVAEASAINFVNKNVKLFAREENSTMDLPQYSIERITSYQEDKKWVILMHVSSNLNNETKKNVRRNKNG